MAALAVVAVVLTAACSNDDDMEPSQAPHHVVTSKFTVNMADTDDATRALNADWTKNFVVGEKIMFSYRTTTGTVKDVVSNPLTAADIQNGGKSANFTVTMTDPRENGDFWIYYPAKVYLSHPLLYDLLDTQDGTFSSLASDLEYADCYYQLSGYQIPSSTVLKNQISILKVKIKDSATGNDITSSVTKLVVSNKFNTHTITPTSSLSTIYVAVRGMDVAWTFTAYIGTDVYKKTTADDTYFANGKVYPINVTVEKQ
jgi:hypothetical protein